MYRIALTYFLVILSLSVRSHDMRMAQFTVHVEGDQLICEGRIDKEDFQAALGVDISNDEVEKYLKSHLSFKFNATDVEFSLVSYELKKNIISVRFSLETTNHHPTEIEVLNTILSEEIEDHDNIMRFVLHEKTRTFRFNKKRETISFNY